MNHGSADSERGQAQRNATYKALGCLHCSPEWLYALNTLLAALSCLCTSAGGRSSVVHATNTADIELGAEFQEEVVWLCATASLIGTPSPAGAATR